MDQRDGVTAVTATRYPFGSREERRREDRQGPRAAGGGGRAPSRRHGRHSPRSGTRFVVLAPASRLVAVLTLLRPRLSCLPQDAHGLGLGQGALGLRQALAGARVEQRRERNNCVRFLVVFSFCF